MKTLTQFTIAFFFIISSTLPAVQSQTAPDNHCSFMEPRKVIYDENEIILPNSLKFITYNNGNTGIAFLNNNSVLIQWQTIAEINTSHFELQRSENGKYFEPIETVTAAGISTGLNRYASSDKIPGLSLNRIFYKVKTVFINGKEDISPAFQVSVSTATTGLDNTYSLDGYVTK